MDKKIIIVGGIPEPIGGVTTFISRILCSDNRIKLLIDFYYSKNKIVPDCYKGKYVNYKFKLSSLIYAFFISLNKNNIIHFNFSNVKSLIMFLMFPRINKKMILMLHHGNLYSDIPNFLLKYLLSKFNKVIAISEQQEKFYLQFINHSKIIRMSSYYPPTKPILNSSKIDTNNLLFKKSKIALCSGYPKELYHIDWCIEVFSKIKDSVLIVCTYGDGDQISKIIELVKKSKNIIHYHNLDENDFNLLLSKSHYYIRPTSIDSFGIAVADANNFGLKVLASNVCKRYQETYLLNLFTYDSFEKDINLFLENKYLFEQEKDIIKNFNYSTLIKDI